MEPPLAEKCLQMVENYQTLEKPFLDGSLVWTSVACLYGYQMYTILLGFYYLHGQSHAKAPLSVRDGFPRHPELKSKYTRQYDHQHAKCEDPELIKGWYNRVQETIQKLGHSRAGYL